MKIRIVKKLIPHYYVDAEDWNQYYIDLVNKLNYFIQPIQWSTEDKPHGYRIFLGENIKIPVYQIWYYDEFNSRSRIWNQYKWSEFHDRSFDDCVLTLDEAKDKAKECKIKYENRYGIIIDEFNI